MAANFRTTAKAKLDAMVGKDLSNQHFYFGYDKASERTGQPSYRTAAKPTHISNKPQALGDPEVNLQAKNYDNDHKNDWVRGRNESGEKKPAFDHVSGRQPLPKSPALASAQGIRPRQGGYADGALGRRNPKPVGER
jgi:hypothetical protein